MSKRLFNLFSQNTFLKAHVSSLMSIFHNKKVRGDGSMQQLLKHEDCVGTVSPCGRATAAPPLIS